MSRRNSKLLSRREKGPIKVVGVVGARPNFMKMDPIFRVMARYPETFSTILVHTGQHYDQAMSKIFFDDLEMRKPDVNLSVGSGTHAQQTANVMLSFEPVVMEHNPDLVIVVGDVNSTVAATMTAVKLRVPVAHVESGLRSFDRTMPEEINRIATDHLSRYLFTPSRDADENLKREGVCQEWIHLVGNVMIDSLNRCYALSRKATILDDLSIDKEGYAVVTVHRTENVDDKERLLALLTALKQLQEKIQVVWAIHPRTYKAIGEFGFTDKLDELNNVKIIDPLGYIDFLALQSNARLILTDSGGVQEEASVLGIPCLTLRENTERPVTVQMGTNEVVGCDPGSIARAVQRVLDGEKKSHGIPELWDGHTAERIVDVLAQSI